MPPLMVFLGFTPKSRKVPFDLVWFDYIYDFALASHRSIQQSGDH